ncbi:cupin domain-containing protein [Bosea sp. (in: a-proteobacteria)]|uniref:cupin domain-containing protein n=1 Tax=Bosea sp. (in: a-proteobacteria) TaxID=1871050 RepID=UPI002B489F68|nr:cupin domain-containing protein [Bosea sp. (in: a-proteobacteria)]WRH59946.1 MAG: cupin domain-containing protein [Bosea sp. (in: a-proteobacteria)]
MTTPALVMLHRATSAPPASAPGQGLGPADPFAAGREIAWRSEAAAAGRCAFSGTVDVAAFPHTETLVVLSGALTLSVDRAPALSVGPHKAVVIGRGTKLRIEAAPGTFFAFHAQTAGTSAMPGATLITRDLPLSPSTPPAPEVLLGPSPQCRSHNVFTDEAVQLRAGLWDSTPYARISRPHRLAELMHILEGAVDLTTADGTVVTVAKGETVFVPQGAPCAWTSRVHVAKVYVVQENVG